MDEELDAINVVPLVDVMLVLLTIVLTTATFIVTGHIPVDLARAGAAPVRQEAPLILTLTLQHELYLNDRPVSDLARTLAGLRRDSNVLVRADGCLELREFVELVDRVKGMGFAKISLEVRRK